MRLIALDLKICMFCVNNAVPGATPFRNNPPGIPETHVLVFPEVHKASFLSALCHKGVDFAFKTDYIINMYIFF